MRSCSACQFWRHFGATSRRAAECRRFPPVRVGMHGTEFPEVGPDDWCGEFMPDAVDLGGVAQPIRSNDEVLK